MAVLLTALHPALGRVDLSVMQQPHGQESVWRVIHKGAYPRFLAPLWVRRHSASRIRRQTDCLLVY
jgi:hypothetical protein